MSTKPALVFVPGAWHKADTWDKVTKLMESHGYRCLCVSLPTTASNRSANFKDDIDATRDLIVGETTQGRDVVVVVHFYGSMPGASAMKGLTGPKQGGSSSAKDPSGHVVGMCLMATGFPLTGVAFLDRVGGKPPPFWRIDEKSGYAVLTADTRRLFYHDLPEEEGKHYAGQLQDQSLEAFYGGEHAYAGWKEVPCWYLATLDDQALPVEAQRMFVQVAKEAGGDVTLREVVSSHSPMLSKPEETGAFLLEALAAFKGERNA
jgi:hypothetical protein